MPTLQVVMLGGCLLHGPINGLRARARKHPELGEPIAVPRLGTGGNHPACYSFGEMFQAIAFYRRQIEIPPDVRLLCGMAPTYEPLPDSSALEQADAILVEPSTPLEVVFRGYTLNRTEIYRWVLDPIRATSKEAAKRGNVWFNKGLEEGNEEVRETAAQDLIGWIPEDMPHADLARAVLREARCITRDVPDAFRQLLRLTDRPVGVVTYVYQILPDGRTVTWPRGFIEQVIESADAFGLPLIEPWRLVTAYGVRQALLPDLRHYSEEFLPIIGGKLAEFARSAAQAGRTAHADASRSLPTLSDAAG